jgi:hypothetical protein
MTQMIRKALANHYYSRNQHRKAERWARAWHAHCTYYPKHSAN